MNANVPCAPSANAMPTSSLARGAVLVREADGKLQDVFAQQATRSAS